MEDFMLGFILAMISGALMSIQGVFNTNLTKHTSIWLATGWVHFSAFGVCILAWLFYGRNSISALWHVENKYTLLGGILGVFITVTVVKSIGSLGPAKATLLIVIVQILVSYIIELFGIWGVEKTEFVWRKLWGILVAVVGVILFQW